jgi:hypothetical protein
MALPDPQFVTTVDFDHLGFPEWEINNPNITLANATSCPSPALPSTTIPQQVLQYGINCQRVGITYTPGAATAVLTWLSGQHDFLPEEWLNLKGFGGVNTEGVADYYEVLSVTSNTQLTIKIPEDKIAGFAPTAPTGSEVTRDLLYSYVWMLLDGQTSITNNLAQGKLPLTIWATSNMSLGSTSPKFGSSYIEVGSAGRMTLSWVGNMAGMYPAFLNHQLGQFAIDMWIRLSDVTTNPTAPRVLYRGNSATGELLAIVGDKLCLYHNDTLLATGDTSIIADAWTHVALTRRNGVLNLFVNGVKQTATAASPVQYSGASSATFHALGGQVGQESILGAIQNVRLTLGHYRWDSDFTPPEYQPTLSPGIGYFVTRGGDIVESITSELYGTPGVADGYTTTFSYSTCTYLHVLKKFAGSSKLQAKFHLEPRNSISLGFGATYGITLATTPGTYIIQREV